MKGQRVLIIAGKGGVGKTTIAVNMAVLWAHKQWQVGLLDADIHSPNIPRMLGIHPQGIEGLVDGIEPASPMKGLKVVSMALFLHNQDTPITWRGPIKQGVIKQFVSDSHWGELDCLIVDLPAGTGDEAISAIRFLKGTIGALIITTPQALSVQEAYRTAMFFNQLKVPIIGLVENMADFACPHCEKPLAPFGEGGGEKLADDLNIPFVGRIPVDPLVAACSDKGEPLITSFPESVIAGALRKIGQQCQVLMDERGRLTLVTHIVYKD
jgi:ATP-binding protein involved in chromosome partitioning